MGMATPTDGTAYTGTIRPAVVRRNEITQTISIYMDMRSRTYHDVTPVSDMPIPVVNKNIKKGRSSGKRKRDTNPRTKGQW